MICSGQLGLSVVVLLLDDWRADHLAVLEAVNARLASHAVVLDRAYVTVPMCCPERASFLAGGFMPQAAGVLTNSRPLGGATEFEDTDTLATRLQSAGYATALFGKYLNEHTALGPYVPPGWTAYAAVAGEGSYQGFEVMAGSSTASAPGVGEASHVAEYVTAWQARRAREFVRDHPEEPLFVYLGLRAPHMPHEPAPSDKGAFSEYSHRSGAFNEADVSDKPAWMQALPTLSSAQIDELDSDNSERLETLLSVDREVLSLLDTLDSAGRLESTVVVLTSDNGLLWGEHRYVGKGVGYEEAVRVPLVVWAADLEPRHSSALVAMNLDVPATISDLAGLPHGGDGSSLRSVLCAGKEAHRPFVPLQAWLSDRPAWAGVVTQDWKYLESGTGEVELYALGPDPAEAESRAGTEPVLEAELAALTAGARGLAVTDTELPGAVVGASYSHAVGTWGGSGALHFEVVSGQLPPGLRLSEEGELAGTPTRPGTVRFVVHVADESVSPFNGRGQRDQRELTLTVSPAPSGGEGGGEEPACGCASGSGGAASAVGLALASLVRRRP